MDKRIKKTKYLFSKMDHIEDGIEHCVTFEEKSEMPGGKIYDKISVRGSNFKKLIKDYLMLVTTLGAVVVGATVGNNEIKKNPNPSHTIQLK